MANTFLRSYAFGLNDEISALGQMAMQDAMQFPTGGDMQQPPPQQQPMAPPPMATMPNPAMAPAPAQAPDNIQDRWYQGMVDRGIDPVFAQGMLPNIGDESGWNTSVQEANPTGKGGRGAYQLTGPRREEFERRYGEDGYTDENQLDFLAWEVTEGPEKENYQRILANAGGDPRKAAAGIVTDFLRPSAEHQEARANKYLGGATMSSRGGPTGRDTEATVDMDEMEEDLPDMSEGAQRRRKWGSVLEGLGAGFGQMSRGDRVDLSDVIAAYHERQSEMQDRISEFNRERRRQVERKEDVGIQEDRDTRLAAMQEGRDVRLAEMQEAASIRGEGRGEAATIRGEERQTEAALAEEERLQGVQKGIVDNLVADSQDPNNPNAAVFGPVADLMRASGYTMDFSSAFKQLNPDDTSPEKMKLFRAMDNMGTEERGRFMEFLSLTGQNINLGSTIAVEEFKSADKRVQDSREALSEAETALPALQNVETILDTFGNELPSGPIEATIGKPVRDALENLGLLDSKGEIIQGAQSLMQSQQLRLVPLIRAPGSQSNFELENYLKANPGIGNSYLGNRLTAQAMRGDINYRRAKQEEMDNWLFEQKTMRGFDQHWKGMEQSGDTPINFADLTDTSQQNKTNINKALERGDIKAGSVIVAPLKGGGKTFVVVTDEMLQRWQSE